MFDLTDLNLRYRAHYQRAEDAGRAVPQSPSQVTRQRRLRLGLAGALLRVSAWLAPEEVERVRRRETAAA